MSGYPARLFGGAEEIREIGLGLLGSSLPREKWTHEAHLAACTWILSERRDIDAARDMPDIIRRYNEAVGGVNDDHQGYHETITQIYILAVRAHIGEMGAQTGLLQLVNSLLLSPRGQRDFPLRHYTRDLLFSVAARKQFLPPDLLPLHQI